MYVCTIIQSGRPLDNLVCCLSYCLNQQMAQVLGKPHMPVKQQPGGNLKQTLLLAQHANGLLPTRLPTVLYFTKHISMYWVMT